MRETEIRELYLELLKNHLTDFHNPVTMQLKPYAPGQGNFFKRIVVNTLINKLAKKSVRLISSKKPTEQDIRNREVGIGWPLNGYTMIGIRRMNNIRFCVEDVIANNVPGDLIETGVWRGGATIFMRAILKVHSIADRNIWVADSFQGLPRPDEEKYPADKGDDLYTLEQLRISMEDVKANFEKFGLLDDQVNFLKGWFKDTLPTAPINKLAVVRLDGDMYESTMDGLVNLYPKLSVGGYMIIDDYGAMSTCAQAVTDYREKHGIADEIIEIDWSGRYWQKMK